VLTGNTGGLDLEYVSKRIQPALNAALEDRARMMRWQSQKVAIDAVAVWADDRLSAQWGKKAAARVFHICDSGNDVEIDDPFAPGPASKKPIRYLSAVPGAPPRASTKYDVAQAMSFVATRRKNTEERFARQDEIPGLLKQLSALRRHPTMREGSFRPSETSNNARRFGREVELNLRLAGRHKTQAPQGEARTRETSSEQLTLMLPASGITDSPGPEVTTMEACGDRLAKIYGAVLSVSPEKSQIFAAEFYRDYRRFLVNEGEHDLSSVRLFTGGFEGTGDSVSELDRLSKSLGPLSRGRSVLMEDLDIYILDFVLWYHLDLIFADQVQLKASFQIGKAYALRDERYCAALGAKAFYFPLQFRSKRSV
jgi:hypothetical protein